MAQSERTTVTVSTSHDGETLTATQDYSEEFDRGHYRYSITDEDGNIVSVHQSMGGPPQGKLIEEDAKVMLERFVEERERWGE